MTAFPYFKSEAATELGGPFSDCQILRGIRFQELYLAFWSFGLWYNVGRFPMRCVNTRGWGQALFSHKGGQENFTGDRQSMQVQVSFSPEFLNIDPVSN